MAQASHSADADQQPPDPCRGQTYVPALDGLRALAILLVVASHAGLSQVLPGAFGVTLFFFISGYLITRQLLHRLSGHGRIDWGGFYLRRALRLLPAFLAYVLVAGLAFMAGGGRIGMAGWLAALFHGANLFEIWIGYRSSLAGVRHPFNILWSLAIEEHFYAVWPALLAAIWRWRAALGAVLLLCLAVLAWRAGLYEACDPGGPYGLCGRGQTNAAWRGNRLYLGTDTRFDSLAWGALLALAESRRAGWAEPGGRAAAFGAALLAASFLLPGRFAREVLRTSLQGAALFALLPAILWRAHGLRRALSCRPAVVVGRLSYSLYLWHWGAFALADALAGGDRVRWLAIGLPGATALSALSYAGIERPMLLLRRRAGSQVPMSAAATAAAPRDELPQEIRHAAT